MPLKKPVDSHNASVKSLLETVMQDQLFRLSSFASFPKSSSAYPIRLANAGFTYLGVDEEVNCLDCGLQCRNWDLGDLPMDIHMQQSPHCPFVAKQFQFSNAKSLPHNDDKCIKETMCESTEDHVTQAVPKDDNHIVSENLLDQFPRNDKQSKDYDIETIFSTPTSSFEGSSKSTNNMTSKQLLRNLGITCERPKHPQYAILVVRISSFRKWPCHLSQSPKELAQAGFFYTEQADLVRCFHCGGGLTNWERDDDPFVEHAHWFPDCIFLRQCKGDQFIQHIQTILKEQQKEANCQSNNGENHTENESSKNFCEGEDVNCGGSDDTMSSPAVKSVLEMGYSLDEVKSAMNYFTTRSGKQEYSALDIMSVLLEFEEKGQVVTSFINMSSKTETEINTNEVKEEIIQFLPESERSRTEDIRSLQKENKSLKEQTICKICMDDTVSIVFLPCGHMATCYQCAPALKCCPICRTFVKGTVKAFLV